MLHELSLCAAWESGAPTMVKSNGVCLDRCAHSGETCAHRLHHKGLDQQGETLAGDINTNLRVGCGALGKKIFAHLVLVPRHAAQDVLLSTTTASATPTWARRSLWQPSRSYNTEAPKHQPLVQPNAKMRPWARSTWRRCKESGSRRNNLGRRCACSSPG